MAVLPYSRRIVLVWRGAMEALPPAMSLAGHLARAGCDVWWISGTASNPALEEMTHAGVKCVPLGVTSTGAEPPVEKIANALRFRERAWREIQKLGKSSLLWVLNGETAIVLGRELSRREYVLHLYELHESTVKRYLTGPHIRRARAVVCAERGRAAIVRRWHRLASTPIVVPNVPLVDSRSRNQPVAALAARRALDGALANGRRIVLYQGLIREDRHLTAYCNAFARRDSWSLVLMGRDSTYLRRLTSQHSHLIHIDHIDAPHHLQVTSWASVGIVAYNNDSLNNRFCAPNKIHEYAMFGIPILANDVPGLTHTVGRYAAGVCTPTTESAVAQAIDDIEANYQPYSLGSQRLFREMVGRMRDGASQVLNLCN